MVQQAVEGVGEQAMNVLSPAVPVEFLQQPFRVAPTQGPQQANAVASNPASGAFAGFEVFQQFLFVDGAGDTFSKYFIIIPCFAKCPCNI